MNTTVNRVNTLHSQAMDLAEEAEYHKRKDPKAKKIKTLQQQAFELEKQAAMLMRDRYQEEPTRSVLFQSAGWLAYHAELYDEAEQMAYFGLSGKPPHPIDGELRSLLKDVEEKKQQQKREQESISLETIINALRKQPFHVQVQVYNYLRFISQQPLT